MAERGKTVTRWLACLWCLLSCLAAAVSASQGIAHPLRDDCALCEELLHMVSVEKAVACPTLCAEIWPDYDCGWLCRQLDTLMEAGRKPCYDIGYCKERERRLQREKEEREEQERNKQRMEAEQRERQQMEEQQRREHEWINDLREERKKVERERKEVEREKEKLRRDRELLEAEKARFELEKKRWREQEGATPTVQQQTQQPRAEDLLEKLRQELEKKEKALLERQQSERDREEEQKRIDEQKRRGEEQKQHKQREQQKRIEEQQKQLEEQRQRELAERQAFEAKVDEQFKQAPSSTITPNQNTPKQPVHEKTAPREGGGWARLACLELVRFSNLLYMALFFLFQVMTEHVLVKLQSHINYAGDWRRQMQMLDLGSKAWNISRSLVLCLLGNLCLPSAYLLFLYTLGFGLSLSSLSKEEQEGTRAQAKVSAVVSDFMNFFLACEMGKRLGMIVAAALDIRTLYHTSAVSFNDLTGETNRAFLRKAFIQLRDIVDSVLLCALMVIIALWPSTSSSPLCSELALLLLILEVATFLYNLLMLCGIDQFMRLDTARGLCTVITIVSLINFLFTLNSYLFAHSLTPPVYSPTSLKWLWWASLYLLCSALHEAYASLRPCALQLLRTFGSTSPSTNKAKRI